MKTNLTPGIKSVKRQDFPLRTKAGAQTGYKLALPFSFAPGEEFKIGAVRFVKRQDHVRALDPIPASWFADLSEGIQDISDGV